MNRSGRNQRRFTILLGVVFAALVIALYAGIFYFYQIRKDYTLKSWVDLEMQIVQSSARSTHEWLNLRIQEQGVAKSQAEQEVFKNFIDPIRLLQNGDAWIYNRDYVIFDQSSDFPAEYRGKSMAQIFALQKPKGASHYDELIAGVTNATQGTGWYIWLPDKGPEYVAWTSVRLQDDTWTIGLSTPESEIIAFSGLRTRLLIEITGVTIFAFFLLGIFIYVNRQQIQGQVYVVRLEQAVADRTASLAHSEARYRSLVEGIREGIIILDLDMLQVLYVNPAVANLFESDDNAKIKADVQTCLASDRLQQALQRLKEARQDESLPVEICEVKTGTGKALWLEIAFSRIDYDQRPAALLAINDITEAKQATDALLASEHKFRSLVEQSNDAIVLTDENGIIIECNAAQEEILGVKVKNTLGMMIWDYQFQFLTDQQKSPHAYEFLKNNVLEFLHSGEAPWMLELQEREMRRPSDGQTIILQSVIFPIRTDKGFMSGSISRDVTQIRQTERNIFKRNRELALLNRVITAATSALDPVAVLDTALRELAFELNVSQAGAALLDDSGKFLTVVADYQAVPHQSAMGASIPLEGNPASQYVIENKAPLAITDVQQDPRMAAVSELMRSRNVTSILLAPLMARGKIIGTLGLDSAEKREFTEEEITLAVNTAAAAAQAVDNARLFDETQRHLQQLTIQNMISRAIGSSLDLHPTLMVLLDQITTQLNMDAAVVLLYNPFSHQLEYAAGRGFRSHNPDRFNLRLGQGRMNHTILARSIVKFSDLNQEQAAFLSSLQWVNEGFKSYFAMPLKARGELVGVLEIFHRSLVDPKSEWLEFLEVVASQAAAAVGNARLFDSLQKNSFELNHAYEATLEGWVRALALHNQEDEGNAQQLIDSTIRLARALNVNKNSYDTLRRGALLHDIGMYSVPETVIQKPGPLTSEERLLVEKHPVYAADLLGPIEFLHAALDIPYCHHEHWDGSGYPRRLKGEEIPLAARIFAVVDTWHALISDRPYRKAWPANDARDYISQQSGAQFDPLVVTAFLGLIQAGE